MHSLAMPAKTVGISEKQVVEALIPLAKISLLEDIGSGDISAMLIDKHAQSEATIITRENCVYCANVWLQAVLSHYPNTIQVNYQIADGQVVTKDTELIRLAGATRELLTVERTLLNGAQLLSATATTTQYYVNQLKNTNCQLLDTRKTIPGWRLAQKYAVAKGGGKNHRIGLFDAFLIKENHLLSSHSKTQVIHLARQQDATKPIIVEVENLTELEMILPLQPNRILLDNFSLENIALAVELRNQQFPTVELEVSGGINNDNIQTISQLGIDFVSMGCLTKDIKAIDLSMRIVA